MRSSIEYFSYTLEAFLSSRVPYLELEHLLFQLYEQRAELNANCDLVICHELVVRQSMQ